MSSKQVMLSGGNYGGQSALWLAHADSISIQAAPDQFWNYSLVLHTDDMARADFCGCTDKANAPLFHPSDLIVFPTEPV